MKNYLSLFLLLFITKAFAVELPEYVVYEREQTVTGCYCPKDQSGNTLLLDCITPGASSVFYPAIVESFDDFEERYCQSPLPVHCRCWSTPEQKSYQSIGKCIAHEFQFYQVTGADKCGNLKKELLETCFNQ